MLSKQRQTRKLIRQHKRRQATHKTGFSCGPAPPPSLVRRGTCPTLPEDLLLQEIEATELLENILGFLDVQSLCRVAQVCRALSAVRWLHVDIPAALASRLTPTALAHIVQKKRPHVLQLPSAWHMGARLAMVVAEAPTLQHLSLRNCRIDARGMELLSSRLLAGASKLRSLDLCGNLLGDGGAAALAGVLASNRSLRRLNLAACHIGEAGGAQLGKALTTNRRLQHLDLSDNNLRAAGTEALAAGLTDNSTLLSLDLSENNVQADGARSLARALLANHTLSRLVLQDNRIESPGAVFLGEALQRNRGLQQLDLQSNRIFDDGMAAFRDLLASPRCGLRELSFWDNPLCDSGVRLLCRGLQDNKSLETLVLNFVGLTTTGADYVAEALENNAVLTRLNLRFNAVGSKGAQRMAMMLHRNSTLRHLNLEDCRIGDRGAQLLGRALGSNLGLHSLSLRGNSIGDTGALGLASGLEHNSTLKVLDLTGKQIMAGRGAPGSSGPAASRARRSGTLLTVGPRGAQGLAEALSVNGSLTSLQLANNSIDASHNKLFPRDGVCEVEILLRRKGIFVKRKQAKTLIAGRR